MLRVILAAVAGIAAIGGGYAFNEGQIQRERSHRATALTSGGDPVKGRGVIRKYGCGGCHQIPGIAQARGMVGPPLAGVGERVYLAGRLENNPSNMMRWIQSPKSVDPQTAMPDLGLSGAEARDTAAYLYTLDR